MKLYNIKKREEQVSFKEAVLHGLATDGGLYFPQALPFFEHMDTLLGQDFVSRSSFILQHILQGELTCEAIDRIVKKAFNFPLCVKQLSENIIALELFWGPTLAFKDFGARFMANVLAEITQDPLRL